jgi:hypothetical protein
MSSEDSSRKKPPSFSGNSMPMNINPRGLDEGGEETTRRLGFQPSFECLSSFQPPSMGETKVVGSSKSVGVSARGGKIDRTAKEIWKLKRVPTLPEYHPLERTAVFVPNASPSDVSIRISDVLRERSIEAFYDDEKAKVKCITAEGVDFRVRLYRGRGRFDHGIIVEVQRRFGASNTFYNDTMAILDAAEGKVPPPPSLSSCNIPLVSDGEADCEPVDGSSSLLMVSKMLSHPGYDSHYLALQTLSSLTDSSKMGAATAQSVSTELLRLDTDNDVGARVLSLVIDKQGEDDTFKLRSMALQVIANAFQAVKGKVPSMLKEQLRSVLIQELRQAETNPRTAVQAARVLEFYVPEDIGSDLHNALESALEAGAARHASLERQAQVCLDKLE